MLATISVENDTRWAVIFSSLNVCDFFFFLKRPVTKDGRGTGTSGTHTDRQTEKNTFSRLLGSFLRVDWTHLNHYGHAIFTLISQPLKKTDQKKKTVWKESIVRWEWEQVSEVYTRRCFCWRRLTSFLDRDQRLTSFYLTQVQTEGVYEGMWILMVDREAMQTQYVSR